MRGKSSIFSLPKQTPASGLMNGFRWALPLLVVPTLLLSGCHTEPAPEAPAAKIDMSHITLDPAQEQNIGLQVAPARRILLQDETLCSGQIQSSSLLTTPIFAPASGRITSINAMLGQPVSAGQPLATVRSDVVGQMQSDLLQQSIQNTADYRQAKVQLSLSKANYDRERELFNEQIGARADMETARAQYQKDQQTLEDVQSRNSANVQAGQARLGLYGVGGGSVRGMLRNHRIQPSLTITAPRSGLVIERDVNPGEMVDTSKELFNIADLSRVWLVGSVYEQDIPKVHLGQPVNVVLDSIPGQSFSGRVNFVSEMLNPQTRTLDVRAEIPNPGFRLKPNMFAHMKIRTGARMALTIPQTAIQKVGDFTYVYVRTSPDNFEERKVMVGQQDAVQAEITSGLHEGEMIAIQGTTGLKGAFIIRNGNAAGGK